MYKIIFPCTSYLIVGGKLLFSNGEYESWATRVGEMKVDDNTKFEEDLMDEDYEHICSKQHFSEPFYAANIGNYKFIGDGGSDMFVFLSFNKKEGGFLIPIQCKYRSNEHIQIYDSNMVYNGGFKSLNHYIKDFDELLTRMVPDKNEVNYPIRYGMFIVNEKVNIPEKYPRTKNLILVIHDHEINTETIQSFFNRIHTSNHSVSQQYKHETFCSPRETIINKTDKAIIAAQTEIVKLVLNKIDNETWINEKDKLITIILDTVSEVNTCLAVTDHDKANSRYEQELHNRRIKYLGKDNEIGIITNNHMIKTDAKDNTFNMTSLKESLEFDILDVVKSL